MYRNIQRAGATQPGRGWNSATTAHANTGGEAEAQVGRKVENHHGVRHDNGGGDSRHVVCAKSTRGRVGILFIIGPPKQKYLNIYDSFIQ